MTSLWGNVPQHSASFLNNGANSNGGFTWCLLVLAGLPRHPHHPQVGPAELGQSLGGVRLLGLLPSDQVSRSGGPYTHTHTELPGLRWISLKDTKDERRIWNFVTAFCTFSIKPLLEYKHVGSNRVLNIF